ncbi:MAG: sugar transferase [Candidatus Omnitrophica bacterium]|nr:sugar transferase [Candidatus Omnitrophota bacterium]
MSRIPKKVKSLLAVFAIMTVLAAFVSTAWATFSAITSVEKSYRYDLNEGPDVVKIGTERAPRARAPEPTTLALFGSGLMGMIISFVRRTYARAKRIFDILASIVGIMALSPVFLLTALLIKLTSKGPVFYFQVRVGKMGRLFNMYKFRTMKVNAEKETGPVWAAANDNRLTPIGNFLRKTHIDEIPQFINILKGEMSLIGPRPERPVFVERFKEEIKGYERRLAVKPGITGLAQVWHRYDETIADVKKKLRYDLLYIEKMCFWADINIMLRTFRVVATGEGAR